MRGKWVFHTRAAPWWRVWVLATLVLQSTALTFFTAPAVQAQGLPAFASSSVYLASMAMVQASLVPADPFTVLLQRRGPSAVRLSSREAQLYETTQQDKRFVFQTAGRSARLRLLCGQDEDTLECDLLQGQRGEEIILLVPTRSPRGDVIYKDVDGKAVLRVTANGGATLFAMGQNDLMLESALVPLGGKAVLPVIGEADPLRAPITSYGVVEKRMRLATELINTRYGSLVTFIAPAQGRGDHAVLADAVLTAAKGIDLVASDALGASIIKERLETAQFIAGDVPGLDFQDGVLTVIYAQEKDIAGRPSSAMVARFLEAEL